MTDAMVNTDDLPREDRYAIAVDLGTTGLKVGLVSFTGQIAWTDHHVLETRRPAADAYEQDAGEWWTVILAMLGTGLLQGLAVTAKNLVGSFHEGKRYTTIEYPEQKTKIPVGVFSLSNWHGFPPPGLSWAATILFTPRPPPPR